METIEWKTAIEEALRLDPDLTTAEIAAALNLGDQVVRYRLAQSNIEIKKQWRRPVAPSPLGNKRSPGAAYLSDNSGRIVWIRRNKRIHTLDPAQQENLTARLGKEPDTALAAEFGLYPQLVATMRKELDIDPFDPQKNTQIDKLHPGLSARLGKESDMALAAEFGLSKSRIHQLRAGLGIPPVSQYVPDDPSKKHEGSH